MPRPSARFRIVKFRAEHQPEPALDDLAAEEPLEIRVNGRPVSITMRTPGQDEELALGFLLGEGVITDRSQVAHARRCERDEVSMVEVTLADPARFDPDQLRRNVFVSSSCGICGAATLDAVRRRFAPARPGPVVSPGLILQLADRLRAGQATFERTGGLHAAGLFTMDGQQLFIREDVGRHNAVDKVVGAAFQAGLVPLAQHVLVVSGRASFEIVQKALAAAIPIIAAVSAPSSLAVELADESNLTLVGFLRPGRFNVYSHPERLGPGFADSA